MANGWLPPAGLVMQQGACPIPVGLSGEQVEKVVPRASLGAESGNIVLIQPINGNIRQAGHTEDVTCLISMWLCSVILGREHGG